MSQFVKRPAIALVGVEPVMVEYNVDGCGHTHSASEMESWNKFTPIFHFKHGNFGLVISPLAEFETAEEALNVSNFGSELLSLIHQLNLTPTGQAIQLTCGIVYQEVRNRHLPQVAIAGIAGPQFQICRQNREKK